MGGLLCGLVSLLFIAALVAWTHHYLSPPFLKVTFIVSTPHSDLPIVRLISRLDTVDYICPTWKRNVTRLCAGVLFSKPDHWGIMRFLLFFPLSQTCRYFNQRKLLRKWVCHTAPISSPKSSSVHTDYIQYQKSDEWHCEVDLSVGF